ncbi:hypothetical protein DID88_008009 [Monilinia fructigena]|uniref:Flavin-nucleotide-binding protein n=1 Tax=Monilinia fructigena TaxID=38457 RepID=A0A395J424_9HELO|nr:hypothetical protein DID88_008009 [Monilinia fructigena]
MADPKMKRQIEEEMRRIEYQKLPQEERVKMIIARKLYRRSNHPGQQSTREDSAARSSRSSNAVGDPGSNDPFSDNYVVRRHLLTVSKKYHRSSPEFQDISEEGKHVFYEHFRRKYRDKQAGFDDPEFWGRLQRNLDGGRYTLDEIFVFAKELQATLDLAHDNGKFLRDVDAWTNYVWEEEEDYQGYKPTVRFDPSRPNHWIRDSNKTEQRAESRWRAQRKQLQTCYPKIQRNTVQRYRARATYDHKTIHTIINSSPILHVSFHTPDPEDPFPAILPMLGFMGIYSPSSISTSTSSQDKDANREVGEEGENDIGEGAQLYLHGYVSSRLMRMGKSASEGGSGEDGEGKGLPMTVAASCLDGLVLSLTPNNHSYNYRSAILQGYGQIVEDADEKLWAMKKITNTVINDRWENTRVPPTKTEMTTTQILRLNPLTASSKSRRGPLTTNAAILRTRHCRERVWTGVVPVFTRYGVPIPGEECMVEGVPEHISKFIEFKNKGGRVCDEEGRR